MIILIFYCYYDICLYICAMKILIFVSLFLLTCLPIYVGCTAIKQNKEFYFEVAKVFTETNIKKLFAFDEFSFATAKDINVKKTFETAKLVELLGQKLAYKITASGHVSFVNEKIETFIVWKTENEKTTIHYIRKAK